MTAYHYPLIIKQLLITPLRQWPNQEIVYRDRVRLTYREFGDRVARLGAALGDLGVKPGDVVAVMDWDSHRYLECFFAVPMTGATLFTVNVRLSPDQIAYILNHSKTDVILCNSEFMPLLQQLRPHLPSVKKFICLDDDHKAPADFAWDGEYEALLAAATPLRDFPEFDENTRATMFYTTGTTGNPKGVFYSHRQIVLHTLTCLGVLSIKDTDVYMPITPMFHVHAWGNPYNATVRGIKQVYPGRYQPDMLARLFITEGVTFSHCVPTILQMFLDAAKTYNVDLSRWHVIIGGSAMPRALARQALDQKVDVISGWGMSETGPIGTVSILKPHLADGGETELSYRIKAGRPAPLVDLRLIDANGEFLPHDGLTAGEVVIRSPWLTQAYVDDAAASEALWRGGWLHTGDIGTIDHEDYLSITDRLKDVIKSGGEWISSLQLESIISEDPDVAEVAVIAVTCPQWGERPLAVVVTKPDAPQDAEAIRARVMAQVAAGQISKFAVPERVVFTDQILRTSVGKFDKKALRALYQPAPPVPPMP